VQQIGSTAHTELQHAPSEHAPLVWGVVHDPLAVAPHRPTQFESAVAAQTASQVTRQQSGYMAQTVLQQSLSEHPGSVCGVRQLSVPLPQFCAVLQGVNTSASEVASATSADDSVCMKFIENINGNISTNIGGVSQQRDAIQGSQTYRPRLHKSRQLTVVTRELTSAVSPRTEQASQIGAIYDATVIDIADSAQAPVSEHEAEVTAANHAIVIQVSGARRNTRSSSLGNIQRSGSEPSGSP
jgi:hypothetical protein